MEQGRRVYKRKKERNCKSFYELKKKEDGEKYFNKIVRKELKRVNKTLNKYNRAIVAATTDDSKNRVNCVKLTHLNQNPNQLLDSVQVAQNVMDTAHIPVKKYRILKKKISRSRNFPPI
jgi:hypothetical protein